MAVKEMSYYYHFYSLHSPDFQIKMQCSLPPLYLLYPRTSSCTLIAGTWDGLTGHGDETSLHLLSPVVEAENPLWAYSLFLPKKKGTEWEVG